MASVSPSPISLRFVPKGRTAHIVAVLRQGGLTRAQLLSAPKLRCIARNGTGVDSIDKATCLEKKTAVLNNPGGNAVPVAEVCSLVRLVQLNADTLSSSSPPSPQLVVGFALTLLRRIGEINTRLRAGETIPSITALAPGLYRRTIGLVGMGDIARETAKMFHYGFNCKIIVFSPTTPKNRWTSRSTVAGDSVIPHERASSLEELLPQVDVLSLHCPYTPATRHMIGERELALFRPSAVIINAARGGIIDEDALYRALVDKTIGGAGIDVWEQEPPPKERYAKLWDLPNVVAMPHFGGSTDEVTRIGCRIAVDALFDYLADKEIRNRVY
jgi:D-3-phosphoglycerate dehydrogenase